MMRAIIVNSGEEALLRDLVGRKTKATLKIYL